MHSTGNPGPCVRVADKPAPVFGLELPALIGQNKELAKWIKGVHKAFGNLGYFLLGLHAAAALFHHYAVPDNSLRRKLPREPRGRTAGAKGGKMRPMNQGFGIEIPGGHPPTPHREPARYLVVIDAGGSTNAMLFLASRKLIAEIDAGTEEATQMTRGLTPALGAAGPEWDAALQGHGAGERRAARVFTLDV